MAKIKIEHIASLCEAGDVSESDVDDYLKDYTSDDFEALKSGIRNLFVKMLKDSSEDIGDGEEDDGSGFF